MSIRILFIADGRSPIARGWIEPLVQRGHEVHLATTFPAQSLPGLATIHQVNVGFSQFGRREGAAVRPPGGASRIGLRALIKHWLGPLTILPAAWKLKEVVNSIEVDIVHALRIPFEGMLAANARLDMPVILSVWGNDFTLHARSSPWMKRQTHIAVSRADGLLADCRRDIRMAAEWGLRAGVPTIVAPGGGGIDRELFHPFTSVKLPDESPVKTVLKRVPMDAPVVINPRGFRAYVRNDTFFRSLLPILEAHPGTHFLMPGMEGESQATRWIDDLMIGGQAHTLPTLTSPEMAALYARSWIVVSPSEHDGTPNTFLEAIACGCFPVVGDLESLREWIEPGKNGILFDPSDARRLAEVVSAVIADPGRRAVAQDLNRELVKRRADRTTVTDNIEDFYRSILRTAHVDGA